MQTFITHSDLK
jgi:hypothetical protein